MASDPTISTIRLPVLVWARLIFDLRRRGAGKGESGAFLFGREGENPPRVIAYVCYDDFDPDAYQNGAIAFHAVGYAALWKHCKENKLEVLADVHTHPGFDVHQSGIDQRHPMLPVTGHTAMIIANYANTAWWSLRAVGIYEYLGNFRWCAHTASEQPPRIKLTLW